MAENPKLAGTRTKVRLSSAEGKKGGRLAAVATENIKEKQVGFVYITSTDLTFRSEATLYEE
ncbi:hypothetical protein CHS0354_029808, partial [Potamilus streckersoni]